MTADLSISRGISSSVNITEVTSSGISFEKFTPSFNTNVTDLAYKSISPFKSISGTPALDTLTLFLHSGSVYQKIYDVPGNLYCPSTISFELLNTSSFSVVPSANFIPLP